MSHNEIIKSYLPLTLVICREQADTDLQPGAENDTVSHFTHVYQSTTPVYVIVAPVLAGALFLRGGGGGGGVLGGPFITGGRALWGGGAGAGGGGGGGGRCGGL